ncbi:MAG: hypothetical protein ACTSR7_14465 [Promethearchaeota archaeon]
MSILLIPIAPLSRTKSRLRDCFSKELLKELTIAMFKDLANKVVNVDCFDQKVVYCNSREILDLAEEYGLVGIKEGLTVPRKSFDEVIRDLNNIAIEEFNAKETIYTFLDVILISERNFIVLFIRPVFLFLEENLPIFCLRIFQIRMFLLLSRY